MLLQLLRGSRVVVYFRNDDQILLVRRDLSGWLTLSVVPFSYVIGFVRICCLLRYDRYIKINLLSGERNII
jgi:hypothetical protein